VKGREAGEGSGGDTDRQLNVHLNPYTETLIEIGRDRQNALRYTLG